MPAGEDRGEHVAHDGVLPDDDLPDCGFDGGGLLAKGIRGDFCHRTPGRDKIRGFNRQGAKNRKKKVDKKPCLIALVTFAYLAVLYSAIHSDLNRSDEG